jgi:hypothetical protein
MNTHRVFSGTIARALRSLNGISSTLTMAFRRSTILLRLHRRQQVVLVVKQWDCPVQQAAVPFWNV